MVFWYIAYIEALPDSLDREFAVLQEGFEDGTEFSEADLEFAILCRAAAESKEDAEKIIEEAAKEIGITNLLGCKLLTSDKRSMVRSERRIARSLSQGDVSIFGNAVGFKKGDASARDQVSELIQDAMTRQPWQFWR